MYATRAAIVAMASVLLSSSQAAATGNCNQWSRSFDCGAGKTYICKFPPDIDLRVYVSEKLQRGFVIYNEWYGQKNIRTSFKIEAERNYYSWRKNYYLTLPMPKGATNKTLAAIDTRGGVLRMRDYGRAMLWCEVHEGRDLE